MKGLLHGSCCQRLSCFQCGFWLTQKVNNFCYNTGRSPFFRKYLGEIKLFAKPFLPVIQGDWWHLPLPIFSKPIYISNLLPILSNNVKRAVYMTLCSGHPSHSTFGLTRISAVFLSHYSLFRYNQGFALQCASIFALLTINAARKCVKQHECPPLHVLVFGSHGWTRKCLVLDGTKVLTKLKVFEQSENVSSVQQILVAGGGVDAYFMLYA